MRAIRPLVFASACLVALGAAACGDSGSTSATSASGGSGPGSGGGSTTTNAGGAGSTTTTTTTSTTTTTNTTTSTGSGPLMCPSEVTNITGDCDLFTQDCPQTNQTCTFVDDGTGNTKTSCVLANGLKGVGQTCASDGECQAHLFCIGDPGTCTPACCPDTDEPCNGGQCNLTVNVQAGPSQGELHFMACTYGMACALFDPSVCPGSEDCHLSGPAFAVCSQPSPTPVGEGEACMYVNDCGESQ
ncbi:MAG TPA: hypothetical protein VL400_17115, partial [Polyangiaceae bacterium]|nr:hypothetical protein [Polyangiaceae bacterium]